MYTLKFLFLLNVLHSFIYSSSFDTDRGKSHDKINNNENKISDSESLQESVKPKHNLKKRIRSSVKNILSNLNPIKVRSGYYHLNENSFENTEEKANDTNSSGVTRLRNHLQDMFGWILNSIVATNEKNNIIRHRETNKEIMINQIEILKFLLTKYQNLIFYDINFDNEEAIDDNTLIEINSLVEGNLNIEDRYRLVDILLSSVVENRDRKKSGLYKILDVLIDILMHCQANGITLQILCETIELKFFFYKKKNGELQINELSLLKPLVFSNKICECVV